jgi:hypothetical protein
VAPCLNTLKEKNYRELRRSNNKQFCHKNNMAPDLNRGFSIFKTLNFNF